MRVFVTGGSGFVGKSMIRTLVESGHEVLALARSESSSAAVTSYGARPVRGDLDDLVGGKASWTAELATVDAIVHAAAYMEFWGPDSLFEERNLRPTVAFHRAAVEAGVGRFVLISAAAVSTGSLHDAVVSEASGEGRSGVAYGRVKLATERALVAAADPRTHLVILRPPFIWGAGMSSIEAFIAAVEGGQFAWVDGGRHTMDFIHVDNLSIAITDALVRGKANGVYYVTDGDPRPIREFLTDLLGAVGVKVGNRSFPRFIAAPMAGAMSAGARLLRRETPPPLTPWVVAFMGRDRSYDITAARTELGYTPKITVAEGMRMMSRP